MAEYVVFEVKHLAKFFGAYMAADVMRISSHEPPLGSCYAEVDADPGFLLRINWSYKFVRSAFYLDS